MSTARAARASDARAREDATTAGETSPRRGQRARAMKTTARADASAMRTTARAERTTSMGRKRARRDGDATAARTTATEEDEREREGEREGVDASGTRATTTATTSANARSANPWSVANSLDVNDVAMVQNLLERSLRLYMSKREVVAHLQALANIDPVLTQLVWGQLEKSNPEFFEAYRRHGGGEGSDHSLQRAAGEAARVDAEERGGGTGRRTEGEGEGEGEGVAEEEHKPRKRRHRRRRRRRRRARRTRRGRRRANCPC